jgi:hypothetical protein
MQDGKPLSGTAKNSFMTNANGRLDLMGRKSEAASSGRTSFISPSVRCRVLAGGIADMAASVAGATRPRMTLERFHTTKTHSGLRISRTFTRLAAITMLKPWSRLALFFSISTAP